jgi:multiple sugar transport system permease protein
MTLRRLIISVLLLIALSLSANEKIVLRVFELPDPKKTDAYTKANLEVVKAFLKKYPNIELQPFTGIKIEEMDLDVGPLMAIAGGVAPDILYVNFRQSDTYIRNNFLYPLDEYINQMSDEELHLRIEKPVFQVILRNKEGEKNKHYWALPYETLVRVMLYRKDLFYKRGLNPNHPPETWDELIKYARILSSPKDGIYGIHLSGGNQAAYDWITYLWSAGGDAVAYDSKKDEWKAVFDSEAGVTAMKFYLQMLTKKWKDSYGDPQIGFAIREGDWGRLFESGKIGMRMGYLSQQNLGSETDPNLVGMAPCPKGPTGLRGAEINCRMMGIYSGAGINNNAGLGKRDPKSVRDAAWKYIHFYDSEEARQIRMKVMIAAGYGKMQNPIYLKRYGYDEYLKYTPQEWINTFQEAVKNGKPEPYGKNCQKVYEYMTIPLENCISLENEGKLGSTDKEKTENIRKILKEGAERTNQMMIGKIPPQIQKKRIRIATVAGILIFALFFYAIYRIWVIFSKQTQHKEALSNKHLSVVTLLLLPAFISIVLWKYLPMLMGSTMAFEDYRLAGDSAFVGFGNFAEVLFDPFWWKALLKTLYYMALSLTLGFLPPVFLAILLQEVSKGKIFYRLIYYLPAIISGIIVIYLWKLLYDPSDAGGLNRILMSLGLPKSMWLKDESLAMLCVVLPSIWAGIGPGCLIYLAALKGIPDDLYEAADLDGAGFVNKIRHIVFPSLKSLLILQFIAAFIASAQQSDFILVMTFGGPNEATKVADLMIFEKAYLYLKFGIATTMAWILGFMLIGFTIIQLKKISSMEFKTYK